MVILLFSSKLHLYRKRRVKSAPREKENSQEEQELDEQLPQEVEGDTSVSSSVETNITDTKTLGNERCAVSYMLYSYKRWFRGYSSDYLPRLAEEHDEERK